MATVTSPPLPAAALALISTVPFSVLLHKTTTSLVAPSIILLPVLELYCIEEAKPPPALSASSIKSEPSLRVRLALVPSTRIFPPAIVTTPLPLDDMIELPPESFISLPVTVKSPDIVLSPEVKAVAVAALPVQLPELPETVVWSAVAPSSTLIIVRRLAADISSTTPAPAESLPRTTLVADTFCILAYVTASLAIVVALLLEVTSPVKLPIEVTVPELPVTVVCTTFST